MTRVYEGVNSDVFNNASTTSRPPPSGTHINIEIEIKHHTPTAHLHAALRRTTGAPPIHCRHTNSKPCRDTYPLCMT